MERPYYNNNLAILCNLTSAAYFYVTVTLFICMLLKETSFAGGIQLIALGVPLIVVIEFFSVHPKMYWLNKEFDCLKNGEECCKYLRYLHSVATSNESDDRNILDALAMRHMVTCTNTNCHMSTYFANVYSPDAILSKRKLMAGKVALITYTKELYKKGLHKFYDCSQLRINYAFFLGGALQDSVNARKQLHRAKNCSQMFDEAFVTFRFCRILEDKITESKHAGEVSMDKVSLIAYKNYYRQCKKKMKEAAKLHIDFWSGLNTQSPDLAQLINVSNHINKVIIELEECWELMEDINSNIPKAILRYAKFLREVLNDEETEKELMKNLKRDHNKRETKSSDSEYGSHYAKQCSGECMPYLLISGEAKSLGTIKNINKAVTRIFGYDHKDLVAQHMDILLPPILQKTHAEILKKVTESLNASTMLNRELTVPCQLANGYFIIATKSIRALPTFSNDMNYVVTFKLDKTLQIRNVCYLLLNGEGEVVSISESNFVVLLIEAVTMLKLSNYIIKQNQTRIEQLFPEIDFDKNIGESITVSYTIPSRTNYESI